MVQLGVESRQRPVIRQVHREQLTKPALIGRRHLPADLGGFRDLSREIAKAIRG